ncbi:DUF1232 domain-containing protein [Leptolyngbya sp. FACHB-541]|uniref:YkvA family protein n=1 Tax=Leptolyngbya sp. FACHB-541 TaxID=2692810 RepID=UPI001685802D|nr:YkvA family protein [Leptolyngbya sp. FACHB-541]MBD1999744.1 DUF1232 domain-containing protein [Leptolyngbya sp. FACHB-541]
MTSNQPGNQKSFVQSIYQWYRSTIRNPKYRWWIILGTLAYFFSPIDIAPDFIPVIGQIDDVMLMTLLVSELSQLMIERVRNRKDEDAVAVGSDRVASSVEQEPVTVDAIPVE